MATFDKALNRKPVELKRIVEGENYARNAAKHMRSQETTLTIDLRDAALRMLVRACDNCDRLDLPRTDRMREFDDWFYEHVIGW